MNDIVKAKVKQAQSLLREFDLPMWIVQFARETYDNPQPVQSLAVGSTVTWPAAFVLTAAGDSVAIVGTGDVASIKATGAYDTVIGYVQDVAPPLLDVLESRQPERIGISTSADDDSADNLTHGMYLVLRSILAGTPYADRLAPADDVLMALRSRKLPIEIERISRAIEATDSVFALIENMLQPGVTEREVARAVHAHMDAHGVEPAWDRRHDPIVNFGPDAAFGHAEPGDTKLAPGMVVHVDVGIKLDGYCSDLQRVWYLPQGEMRSGSDAVLSAFHTVRRSIEAGFDALKPGARGWEVDAAARGVITAAGYDEPQFAFGHQLGQTTHDGGALLGPRWPRYLNRPNIPIEAGMVFTLEFSLDTPSGPIGLEEDVVVTADGARYLSSPQSELTLLPALR